MRPSNALLALLVTVPAVVVLPAPGPAQEVYDRTGTQVGEIRRNRSGVYELYDDRGSIVGVRKYSAGERQMEFVDREGQPVRREDGFLDIDGERFFDVERGRWRDVDEMEKPRRREEPPPPPLPGQLPGHLPEQ